MMATVLLRLIKILFFADAVLIAAHLMLRSQSWLFDLDQENNVPTYFAAAQVLLVAFLMIEINLTERRLLKKIIPGTWIWIVLAAGFTYLAVDDVVSIHEYVLRHTTRDLMPADSLWLSLMPWQIIFGPLFAIIAALLIAVILTRFNKDRTLTRFATAGLCCWILAVLMEGLAKPVFMAQGWYNVGVVIEEGLELVGGTLFVLAFATYGTALKSGFQPDSLTQRSGGLLIKSMAIILLISVCGAGIVIAFSLQNSTWLYRHNAGVLMKRGQYDRATIAFEKTLKENPADPIAWAQLGRCQQQEHKISAAIKSYKKSLQLNSHQPLLAQTLKQLESKANANKAPADDGFKKNVVAHIDNPFEDGWDTEAFAKLADKQIKSFSKLLEKESSLTTASLSPLITKDFFCDALLPNDQQEVFSGEALTVNRGRTDTDSQLFRGAQGFLDATKELVNVFQPAQITRSKFKIFRVDKVENSEYFDTKLYVALIGHNAKEMVEQNATWSIRWLAGEKKSPPRIQSIRVDDFEIVRTKGSHGALFAECTPAVLSDNECYEPQILRGFNHWLQTSQRRRHLFRLGTPGIAVSDVDGDGREDLYLCQEVGLPNRLFLHQEDNRLVDVSKEWGVDWLHDARCPLLFDWDNDGDQDLAVSVLGGVMLAENDGNQKFKLLDVLATSDDTQSMAAADYDQDGDIDLYVCVYRRDGKISGEMTSLVPGAAENFVYHDANTGGPSALFRNDGNGKFTNVTDTVGMGDNNFRFSYGASWDDYDNDGDVDLYVANDFGRDNLYQNTDGKFKDIADEANIENSASGMAVISGDYDNDGWTDIFVSNMWSSAGNRVTTQDKFKADASAQIKNRLQRLARGNTLLKNTGDGHFEHKSADANVEVGRWAWGCQFLDLNNDSWDDLMVANGFITTDDSGDL